MTNPIIYTSEWLSRTPKTKRVAESIFVALEKLNIKHQELSCNNTNDYWCRDYMPVRISDDNIYAKYIYNPDYLANYKTKQKYISNQEQACKGLNLYAPTNMNIVFDGGNYVRCADKVIMTDKIFSENPEKNPRDMLNDLSNKLHAEIILLPWDMNEPCGHTDGMISYLGKNKILLNNCWKKDKAFHKRLLNILKAHFEVIELSYDCVENENSWCYLNYLQVPGGILLPCLSADCNCNCDIAAIKTFEKLFSSDYEIIPIYAYPLIEDGGALHCVTWELYNRHDIK
ncbi:MAG: agmatine deiminase family protein [Bacteroidales bacterium]|nr:agmatine deiminase family protein [Bacteroidales bacterium]